MHIITPLLLLAVIFLLYRVLMGRKDQSAQPSDLAMIKEAIVKLGSDIDDLKTQIEKLKKQNAKESDDKLNLKDD